MKPEVVMVGVCIAGLALIALAGAPDSKLEVNGTPEPTYFTLWPLVPLIGIISVALLLLGLVFVGWQRWKASRAAQTDKGEGGPTTRDVTNYTGLWGGLVYRVPHHGQHPRWRCVFGRHFLSLVYQDRTGLIVGVRCGACRKHIQVHGLEHYDIVPPRPGGTQR